VKEDVLDEIVSIARAREKYGVVLTGSLEDYDIQVDLAATRELRKKMTEESERVNGLSHRH
jgi:N-methylhydantoinase B